MDYHAEKEIEAIIEAEIQEIVDSGKMWYPHNMAFGIRSRLLRNGYNLTKGDCPTKG